MSIVRIKLVNDSIASSLDKTLKQMEPIVQDGFKFYVAHTPIRSGRARSSTRLNNSTINANYPYATALERGQSAQAPDGMTKPTISYLNSRFDKLFRRK